MGLTINVVQCTPGYTLSGVSNPLAVDGLAVLNCHLIDDGNGNEVWEVGLHCDQVMIINFPLY